MDEKAVLLPKQLLKLFEEKTQVASPARASTVEDFTGMDGLYESISYVYKIFLFSLPAIPTSY